MRIIDNKKDYYDYLAGDPRYGVDEHITYDRRNSKRLINKTSNILSERYPMGYASVFCPWKNGIDPKSGRTYVLWGEDWDSKVQSRYSSRYWYKPKKDLEFPDAYNVSCREFSILIGKVYYIFDIKRVLMNETDLEVKLIPTLKRKFEINRSNFDSTAPIIVGELEYNRRAIDWRSFSRRDDKYWDHLAKTGYIRPSRDGKYDENPIFEGTWIPSIIPAEEIWNNVTDYLLSIKEPKIVDNRTDVQHLESHGFDKKTSFRNVK